MSSLEGTAPILPAGRRIVGWVSCGAASAVAAKLLLAQRRKEDVIVLARCLVPEEDPDNDRFAQDCAQWFGQNIVNLKSVDYASCEDVWRRRRYMSGIAGAPCTLEMKKRVRQDFEREWHPDIQVFGYTVDEKKRADEFRANNPDVILHTPLIDAGLSKDDCFAIVHRAGLLLPLRYRQGFPNANCRGCVKNQSAEFWKLERRVNPEIFAARDALSRELGVRLIKLGSGKRERIYLSDLPPDDGAPLGRIPNLDCSLLCAAAETTDGVDG